MFIQERSKGDKHGQKELAIAAGAVVGKVAVAYGTLRLALATYRRFKHGGIRRLVLDVSPVLQRLGVTHWIDFGTLLGLYRDGDIIPHDNDADVVVVDVDWDKLYKDLKAALPQYHVDFFLRNKDGHEVRWVRVHHKCRLFWVDLFGAVPAEGEGSSSAKGSGGGGGGAKGDDADTMIHVDNGRGNLHDVRKKWVYPIGQLEWRGVKVNIPHDTEEVLKHRYGEDWATPRYMDKGRDTQEQQKTYAKVLSLLGRLGLKI